MHRHVTRLMLCLILALAAAYFTGCASDITPPAKPSPGFPETELTYAPLPGDTTTFRVR